MGKLGAIKTLSPFGPIFTKELRATARRKRTYFLRFFYLAALLLVLVAVYTSTSYRREALLSVAERARSEADLGHAFFMAFSIFSIFALPIISPILTATSISAERLGKTLPVLLMTPITSWQIIGGKLFSRLLVVFSLIGLSLPVLAVVRLLGGVELEHLLALIALCLLASLTAAAIGLFYSTFMNRAYAVILLSYATMLFLYVFVPFVFAIALSSRRGPPPTWFIKTLLAINPFSHVMLISNPFARRMAVSIFPCVLVHLGFTALLVFWSAAVLRRQARRQGEPAAQPLHPQFMSGASPELLGSFAPPIEGQADVQTSNHAHQRSVSDNPVLWREVRRPLMARRWQATLGTTLCLGMLLLTYLLIGMNSRNRENDGLGNGELQIGYAVIFCGLLTLLVCVLSATTIAGEIESDTWMLLLATPISGRDIVIGKVLGTLRRLLWPGVLIAGHFLIFTLFGVLPVAAFLLIVWLLFTCNTVWIASGLFWSLKLRKVTFAVILNLLMPVAAYMLVPIVLLIVANVFINRRHSDLPEVVLVYAPYYYLATGVSTLVRISRHELGSLYRFELPMGMSRVEATDFFLVVFAVGVGYLALAVAILLYTIRRFDRIVGRARQASVRDSAH